MLKHSVIDIQARLDQPIASATGLPNERYTSDTAFAQDRDAVLGTGWASIGFVDDLPEANRIQPVDFMGLPLLITRDRDDTFRVFHNVCSHRGMQLADVPCRTNGTVRCPYHSWTYQLDGALRSTPHIGGYGLHEHHEFNRGANGLKPVRSAVWLGVIFINLSGDAPAFDDYIAPLKAQFDAYGSDADRGRFRSSDPGCRTSLEVRSNWKLAAENYLESYHLPTVHPELNRVSPLDQHVELDYFDQGAGQASNSYTSPVISGEKLPVLVDWPEAQLHHGLYPVLYPNTLIGLHADHLFIMILLPLRHDRTRELVRLSYVGEAATDARYQPLREYLLAAWSGVFEEDIFAVERMQLGRQSPGYEGGAFAPAMDAPTVHFHRWVARKLVAHTAVPATPSDRA